MQEIAIGPYVREAGSGPPVVCLHANASSSVQWRGLTDLLAQTHRVLAPDSYGAGKSPDWPSRSRITLTDEVELIEPVLSAAGRPLALVGHSHGGAVAMLPVLPRVRVVELEGIGHMGPLTHPEVINAEIAKFLREA